MIRSSRCRNGETNCQCSAYDERDVLEFHCNSPGVRQSVKSVVSGLVLNDGCSPAIASLLNGNGVPRAALDHLSGVSVSCLLDGGRVPRTVLSDRTSVAVARLLRRGTVAISALRR